MNTRWIAALGAGFVLTGCAALPAGPSVMVLPGNGKGFEEFRFDDGVCRQWAAQQSGAPPTQAATDTTLSGAAIGTALGAASGAAVGAAAGNPAMGAAVGAGLGLFGGTAVGADQAGGVQWAVQHRYDIAYLQCMYAKGNQIPVPGGFERTATPPSALRVSGDVPPPPPGRPPPPPPGLSE
jgi:hypothetical protein